MMLGMVVSGGVSGGHLNPTVTVAVATIGKFPWWKVGNWIIFCLLSCLSCLLGCSGLVRVGNTKYKTRKIIFIPGMSMTVESIAQFQTLHKYSQHFPLLISHMLEEYLTSFWGLLFSSSVFVPSLTPGT